MNPLVNPWLAVALGGALGSMARYGCVRLLAPLGSWIPVGTLAVNIGGSLLVGLLYAVLVERLRVGEGWTALLLVGFLGGFTTFSAFSLEAVRLAERGAVAAMLSYVALSVVLCLGACLLGLWLGRQAA